MKQTWSLALVVYFAFALFVFAKEDAMEIVGGRVASIGSYLYTTGLRDTRDGRSFCGGTLVAPNYVITAAHCLPPQHIKLDLWVSIGSHSKTGTQDGEQIEVEISFKHPKYNKITNNNDIAILKLKTPSKMPTAALASNVIGTNDAVGTVVTAYGWGRTSFPGKFSNELKEVNVTIVSNTHCQATLGKKLGKKITDAMLCAGGVNGEGTCHEDSGGPLMKNSYSKTPILVGLVSFGDTCANGYPDAYSRISYHRSFIDKHVVGHRWCR